MLSSVVFCWVARDAFSLKVGCFAHAGVQSTFYSFDPGSESWTSLKSGAGEHPLGRSLMGSAVLGDHIFMLGGWGMSDKQLRKLDPLKIEWTGLDPLAHDVRAMGFSGCQEKLFVFGGLSDGMSPFDSPPNVSHLKIA